MHNQREFQRNLTSDQVAYVAKKLPDPEEWLSRKQGRHCRVLLPVEPLVLDYSEESYLNFDTVKYVEFIVCHSTDWRTGQLVYYWRPDPMPEWPYI
jgi:hypothetical protein